MSWVQTAYLIAEVIAIPLTGFLTRALSMRWLFVLAISIFTLASLGCAASDSFRGADRLAGVAGIFRRHADPAVFCAVFLLFPPRARALPPHSPACWPCSPPPSDRSSAAGSPRPIPGTGCS